MSNRNFEARASADGNTITFGSESHGTVTIETDQMSEAIATLLEALGRALKMQPGNRAVPVLTAEILRLLESDQSELDILEVRTAADLPGLHFGILPLRLQAFAESVLRSAGRIKEPPPPSRRN
jgi:hypothetical protein